MKVRYLFIILLIGIASCESSEPKQVTAVEIIENPLDVLTKKISADSSDAFLFHERSRIYLFDNQIENSLADINRALQLNGKVPLFFLTLAEIYLHMGQTDGCNLALQKAAELDPTNSIPYFRLSELNLLLKDYTTAMMYADRSLAVNVVNPDAHFAKGLIFLAKQDTANAIREFQFSLDQREDFIEPMLQLGIIYTNQRNPLAEAYLNKAIKTYPDLHKARYQLALYLQDNNQVENALKHYDTLLMQVPDNKYVLFNLGYLNLVYLNKAEEAVKFFDEVLIQDPNYVDALYNKGRALEELGHYLNAREVYTEVLRREENHALSIEALNRLDRRR